MKVNRELLGFKSPLAVADSFTFTTVYDKVKYKYIMYKTEDGTAIDLLHQEETDEKTGTLISIQIKQSDVNEFKEKIAEQLAYFENVYFNVEGIDNDYRLIKHKDWKWSELSGTDKLHICLDEVYYAIDWEKLGISSIDFPVALYFKLSDGLIPTPSREDIKYTPLAKQLINDKIDKVIKYFTDRYNEEVVEADSVFDIWDKLHPNYRHCLTIGQYADGQNIDIRLSGLVNKKDLKEPTVKGLKVLSPQRLYDKMHYIDSCYHPLFEINHGRINTKGVTYISTHNLITGKFWISSGEISTVKKAYLRDFYSNSYIKVVGKTNFKRVLKKRQDSYYNILGLHNIPKEQWRAAIIEWQNFEKEVGQKIPNLDDLVIPQDWLDERKANRKKGTAIKIQKEEIHPKYAEKANAGTWNCKFVGGIAEQTDSLRTDKLYIYGTEECRKKLDNLYSLSSDSSEKLGIVLLVDRDIKRMEGCTNTNWFHINTLKEKIMSKNPKYSIFGKWCVAYRINELFSKYNTIDNNIDFVTEIDTEAGELLKECSEWATNIFNHQYNNELMEEIMTICAENDLWDAEYWEKYHKIVEICQKLSFLDMLRRDEYYRRHIHKDSLPLAKSLYSSNFVLTSQEEEVEQNEEVEI